MKISKEQIKSVAAVLVINIDTIKSYIEANRTNYEKWLIQEDEKRQNETLPSKRRRVSKKKEGRK